MATVVERMRELETRMQEMKHSEFGGLLVEYLKLDWKRNCSVLIREEDNKVRGKVQKIEALLKIFSIEP